MKRVLILFFSLLVLGGGVAALWFFKVPPFGKPARKTAPAAEQTAKTDPTEESTAGSNSEGEPKSSTAIVEKPRAVLPSPSKPSLPRTVRQPALKMTEADLTRLAGVYEQMDVDDAAKIMAKLPDTLVEPLLRRMEEKQVGKLLIAFAPDRAARLTLALSTSGSPL